MLSRLLQKLKAEPARTDPEAERQLAAAVLLLEIARADYDQQPAELEALRAGLIGELGIPEATVDVLMKQADERAKKAVSLFDFVKALNAAMDTEAKRGLLQLLWKVAYADGRIDAQEEHLLRRLADLLHLSHADFIRGKLANSN